jgi:hypothetical protein
VKAAFLILLKWERTEVPVAALVDQAYSMSESERSEKFAKEVIKVDERRQISVI